MPKTQRRRRHEAKTDYHARLNLLKSEKPRLVVRKTNQYVLAQLVETDIAQDKVLTSANSRELIEKGWPKELSGSMKSLGASYLMGILIGKAAQKEKISQVILDMGLQRNIHKSRLYAVVKGALDAGLKIPVGKEALPSIEQIQKSEKLSDLIKKLKEKI